MADADSSAAEPVRLPTGELDQTERAALAACEAVIAESLGAWVNVTNALAEISTKRLYRQMHPTFEAYLRERWGVSRAHGHRLVLAASVCLSPVGDRIANERQAREIAGLLDQPELLVQVVDRAEEIRGGKPLTAMALRQARAELTLPPEEAKASRRVYEAAEWTDKLWDRWQERTATATRRYVQKLPPELWGWGHAEVNRVSQGRALKITDAQVLEVVRRRVAFDAPLTDEVVAFLRDAPVGKPLVEEFSALVDALSRAPEGWRGLAAAAPPDLAEGFEVLATATAMLLPTVAKRMTEVLVAVAEPAGPRRTWTEEETVEARRRWREHVVEAVAAGEVGDWQVGPLLDSVRSLQSTSAQVADMVRESLEGRGE